MSRDDTVYLDLLFVHETALAYGCKEDEGGEMIWLPKSRVGCEDDLYPGEILTFVVPEWLAEAKGLI